MVLHARNTLLFKFADFKWVNNKNFLSQWWRKTRIIWKINTTNFYPPSELGKGRGLRLNRVFTLCKECIPSKNTTYSPLRQKYCRWWQESFNLTLPGATNYCPLVNGSYQGVRALGKVLQDLPSYRTRDNNFVNFTLFSNVWPRKIIFQGKIWAVYPWTIAHCCTP